MTQQPPTGTPDPTAAVEATATAVKNPIDIPDISSSASKFVSNLESAGSAVSLFKNAAMSFGESAVNFMKNMVSSGKDTASAADMATKAASGLSTAVSVIAGVAETNIIGDLSGMLKDANTNTVQLSQSTQELFNLFQNTPKLGDFIKENKMAQKFMTNTQAVMKSAEDIPRVRSYLLESAAAGGQLNEMLGDMSNIDMSNLNEQVKNSAQNMVVYAGTIGTTTEKYMRLYGSLQKEVPNFLTNQKVKVGDQDLTETQAAMVLAEGTGRSTDNLKSRISELGKTFNMSGQSTLEYIAKLSQANDEFKIGIDSIDAFAKKNIDSLAYLSDKGDNSILTLNRMMKGFQDTGLSAKQSAELIGDMTSGIAKMDMAQKGFLSSQTGGAGGLRGAFEIEGLLREGKTNEVMQKIEENIKKNFGGKIFSLKDAKESDYGASQFMTQREMLKSGAFGIQVQDDAKATRILEAMANGFKAEASDMGGAFEKYAGAGKTVMESNVTSFSTANMVLELEKFENGLRNTNLYFDKIGGLSSQNRQLLNEINKETQNRSGEKNRKDNRAGNVGETLAKGDGVLGYTAAGAMAGVHFVNGAMEASKEQVEKAKQGLASYFGINLTGNTQEKEQKASQGKPKGTNQRAQQSPGSKLTEGEMESLNQAAGTEPRNNRTQMRQQVPNAPAQQAPTRTNLPAGAQQTTNATQNPIRTAANQARTPAQVSAETARAMTNGSPRTLQVNVNQDKNNNMVAELPTNIVVPTVEMHVDMTCKNCNGKTTEVVLLKSKQSEIGGITTTPTPRMA